MSEPRKWRNDELVAACVAGKKRAVVVLIRRFRKCLKRGVRRALRSCTARICCADNDELYQELCLELVQSSESIFLRYDPRRPFGSWLFRTAHFFCVKRILSKQFGWPKRAKRIEEGDVLSLISPSSTFELHDDRLTVWLKRLNEEEGTVVVARFGLGPPPFDREWSVPEIAEHFDYSVATAYRHLEFALKRLRAIARASESKSDGCASEIFRIREKNDRRNWNSL